MAPIRPLTRRTICPFHVRTLQLTRACNINRQRLIKRRLRRITPPQYTNVHAPSLHFLSDNSRGLRLTPRVVLGTPTRGVLCNLIPTMTQNRRGRTNLRPNGSINARQRVFMRPTLQGTNGLNVLLTGLHNRAVNLQAVCPTIYLHRILSRKARLLIRQDIMHTVRKRIYPSFPLKSDTRISTQRESINRRPQRVALTLLGNNNHVPIGTSNRLLNRALHTRAHLPMAITQVRHRARGLRLLTSPSTSAGHIRLIGLIRFHVRRVPLHLNNARRRNQVHRIHVSFLGRRSLKALTLILINSLQIRLLLPFPLATRILLITRTSINRSAISEFQSAVFSNAHSNRRRIRRHDLILRVISMTRPRLPRINNRQKGRNVHRNQAMSFKHTTCRRASRQQGLTKRKQQGKLTKISLHFNIRPFLFLLARRIFRRTERKTRLQHTNQVSRYPRFLLIRPMTKRSTRGRQFIIINGMARIEDRTIGTIITLAHRKLPSHRTRPTNSRINVESTLRQRLVCKVTHQVANKECTSGIHFFIKFHFLRFPLAGRFHFIRMGSMINERNGQTPHVILRTLIMNTIIRLVQRPTLNFLRPRTQ